MSGLLISFIFSVQNSITTRRLIVQDFRPYRAHAASTENRVFRREQKECKNKSSVQMINDRDTVK